MGLAIQTPGSVGRQLYRTLLHSYALTAGRMTAADQKFRTSISYGLLQNGGNDGIRIRDPRNASAVLSQLSYVPKQKNLVEMEELESSTSCVPRKRSPS